MIFAGIYKNELSVINVFPSIQCFCLNISEMNRIESTSYSVLITRGISRYSDSGPEGLRMCDDFHVSVCKCSD